MDEVEVAVEDIPELLVADPETELAQHRVDFRTAAGAFAVALPLQCLTQLLHDFALRHIVEGHVGQLGGLVLEMLPIFPFKYFHIDGDEVTKDRWHSCPDCLKRVEEEQLEDVNALQGWFIRRIELLLRNHGRTLIGWDEIAATHSCLLS